jgi:hypothetical protein
VLFRLEDPHCWSTLANPNPNTQVKSRTRKKVRKIS